MTSQSPCDYLAITATGEDQVGLVQRFTNRILDAGCNVEESRMALLGNQFAIIMLVSGRWDALTKLEDRLATVGVELGLSIVQKRTKGIERKTPLVPYNINVVAMDHPGIVHNLANFFAQRGINIEELATDTYPAPHTGTTMFSVNMTVGIPAETHIPTLRGDFLDYCDGLNLDAIFEPSRT
ncbi:MAG: glycine cleavage system protein R [Hydrogenophilales bacterium CG03_land_8_20_14_0_80_62_28]|nr:glycine cleavage system protein R [Betaproteobacteria bacterium]OIO78454.1 MAG: glycine cleavage system protein R [Hydrogenophilaceae bacterium CG1_02_62_390]PIV22040.1 MAG: glycine cleavage system protein R [Hydrogenophilales bacterium CG03_land_8_20_14_0_80_62_28]PIW37947.1 MAG: glycine cleavage system protein R [Hydrogenophilales bacterium CG15_BIG_FIL_POST_REV_8_21_14_020_62_31]PIW72744.1 MAG: glycine cleavage system protein R [Hydrogenophilales bacterium CG12_big_fil_rev_8_21_14_0_65_61